MRTQLRAALEESLIDGPDPTEVLAGIHTGIARRRRRNRYYRTGFAISAIVLVLIVSIAAVSVPKRNGVAPSIPVGVWTSTIRTTWLPADMRAQEFRVTAFGEGISYRSPDSSLDIAIDNVGRNQVRTETSWRRTEINGRPGWEYVDLAATWLNFELPSGRRVEIRFGRTRPDITNAQPDVRDAAMRVARSLEETGDMRLRTKFALSYLPPDQRIIGIETNIFTADGVGTLVCAAGSIQSKREGPGLRISITNVAVNTDLDATTRIADIQGRPAYQSVSGGSVFVAGFHGGTLSVSATLGGSWWALGTEEMPRVGLAPVTELIKVAEGVRWTG